MDRHSKRPLPEGRAAGLSLLTIVSIAGTVISIIKARADLVDRYASLGLNGAIFSYKLPLALTACASPLYIWPSAAFPKPKEKAPAAASSVRPMRLAWIL